MENEFQKSFLETTNLPDIQTYFVNQVFEFQELMMRYNCAIREVRTKLEVLNDELSIHHKRNPIEFITSRIKRPPASWKNCSATAKLSAWKPSRIP